MAHYSYELFVDSLDDETSFFTARIKPPVAISDKLVEDHRFGGMDIDCFAVTESASVYRIDHNNTRISNEDRVWQVVNFMDNVLGVLNSIELNDPAVYANGEVRIDLTEARGIS